MSRALDVVTLTGEEYDDLMDATRYAVMSLRFARAKAERHAHERYRRYRSAEQASGWAA